MKYFILFSFKLVFEIQGKFYTFSPSQSGFFQITQKSLMCWQLATILDHTVLKGTQTNTLLGNSEEFKTKILLRTFTFNLYLILDHHQSSVCLHVQEELLVAHFSPFKHCWLYSTWGSVCLTHCSIDEAHVFPLTEVYFAKQNITAEK